jgi:hypothetical protein
MMMNKVFILVSGILLSLFCLSVFAQDETLTITTYYPSPHGSYRDLSISNVLTFRDPAGGAARVTVHTDATGNYHLGSTTNGFQFIFDDVAQPLAYFLTYAGGSGSSFCANGYVAVNFLKDDFTPADPNNLPLTGYIVCLRGQP